MGLNLVTGYAGMFSLGHHGFYAVGAYAAGFVVTEWSAVDPGSASGLVCFAVSGGAAVLAAACAGLLVGLPCLRLRGDYLAIATLAFGEIVRIVIENTPAPRGEPRPVRPAHPHGPHGPAGGVPPALPRDRRSSCWPRRRSSCAT